MLLLERFLEEPVSMEPAERQDTTEGLAYAPSLINVSDEIILELRSQGVIGVRRLRPKNGKTNANTRLTFSGKTPPTEIRTGFQDHKDHNAVPALRPVRALGQALPHQEAEVPPVLWRVRHFGLLQRAPALPPLLRRARGVGAQLSGAQGVLRRPAETPATSCEVAYLRCGRNSDED